MVIATSLVDVFEVPENMFERQNMILSGIVDPVRREGNALRPSPCVAAEASKNSIKIGGV